MNMILSAMLPPDTPPQIHNTAGSTLLLRLHEGTGHISLLERVCKELF